MVKNGNFRGLRRIWVFAYIARRYDSAAESTSLLSSVASLVLNVGNGLQLCRSVAKTQEPVAGPLSPRFFFFNNNKLFTDTDGKRALSRGTL